MLIAVTPVAIRVAYLREELSLEGDGFGWQNVEELVGRLHACLEQHPSHGRGWAVVALWARRDGAPDAGDMEKRATHYGVGAFLKRELERMSADLDLTEEAG